MPEYTKLLIHSDTTTESDPIIDSSDSGHIITVSGNVHHETDQSKFGASSLYFDGVVDYLEIPNNDDFKFGTAPFAIDFRVRFSSLWTDGTIIDLGQYDSGVLIRQNPANFEVYVVGLDDYIWNFIPTLNVWYHIAVTRDSNFDLRVFIDGVSLGVKNKPQNLQSSLPTRIGSPVHTETELLHGYIDELRVLKGTDRGWTANFTPPTEPYRLINVESKLVITSSLEAITSENISIAGKARIDSSLEAIPSENISITGKAKIDSSLEAIPSETNISIAGKARITSSLEAIHSDINTVSSTVRIVQSIAAIPADLTITVNDKVVITDSIQATVTESSINAFGNAIITNSLTATPVTQAIVVAPKLVITDSIQATVTDSSINASGNAIITNSLTTTPVTQAISVAPKLVITDSIQAVASDVNTVASTVRIVQSLASIPADLTITVNDKVIINQSLIVVPGVNVSPKIRITQSLIANPTDATATVNSKVVITDSIQAAVTDSSINAFGNAIITNSLTATPVTQAISVAPKARIDSSINATPLETSTIPITPLTINRSLRADLLGNFSNRCDGLVSGFKLKQFFNLSENIPNGFLNQQCTAACLKLYQDTGVAEQTYPKELANEWKEAQFHLAYALALPHLHTFALDGAGEAGNLKAGEITATFHEQKEVTALINRELKLYDSLVKRINPPPPPKPSFTWMAI